jgi:hypothetical protein
MLQSLSINFWLGVAWVDGQATSSPCAGGQAIDAEGPASETMTCCVAK